MARTKAKSGGVAVKEKRDGGPSKAKHLAFLVAESIKKGEDKKRSELLREAGYSELTIEKSPQRPWNSRGFIEEMQAAGLGVHSIRKVLEDAMQAREVVSFQGDAKETDAPDHAIRLRATELAAKYTGLDVQRSQNVNINIDAQLDDAFDAFSL
jgi:hypothetical protein